MAARPTASTFNRLALCAALALALNACGGGGSDGTDTATSATATGTTATTSASPVTTDATSSTSTSTASTSASTAASSTSASTTSTSATSTTTSSASTVTAWVRIAAENGTISVSGTQTVRFGDGVNWVTKSVTGSAPCTIAFFGDDPSPWVFKACEAQVTAPTVVQTGLMPVVNTGLMPVAVSGYTAPRVETLTAAQLAVTAYQPTATTVGAFRILCTYSHMLFDDPIVHPGAPGASHLHTFMGNDATNAASTAASISGSGGSTCDGGTLDRSAYWMPTMIDIRTGQPIAPSGANFYYKLGYLGVTAGTVQPFPAGLRIVAGDADATTAVSPGARFACVATNSWQATIPTCAVGDTVMSSVQFPQCWDGVNLDSPDHKSHMAYATGTGCPADHPVPLPELSVRYDYIVTDADNGDHWKLSSDNYTGPGGYSLHADWFNGWDPATGAAFVANCINGNLNCNDDLLGDGRMLY